MGEGVAPCRTHRRHTPGSRALVEKQRQVSDHKTRRTVQRSRKQVGKRKTRTRGLTARSGELAKEEQNPGPVSCTKEASTPFHFYFFKSFRLSDGVLLTLRVRYAPNREGVSQSSRFDLSNGVLQEFQQRCTEVQKREYVSQVSHR